MNPHAAVQTAMRTGRLVRPAACETCGKEKKVVAHHDDYAYPLEVRFLCLPCHRQHHLQHGEARNRHLLPPRDTDKVNTYVHIRKSLSRALRQAAEDENRSLGAQLEVVIEDWLDWREDKPARRRPPAVGRVSP